MNTATAFHVEAPPHMARSAKTSKVDKLIFSRQPHINKPFARKSQ